MNSLVGVAAPSDPVGSIIVKILQGVEGGDVEQVCSNLEINPLCLQLLLLSLSLSLIVYILHAFIAFIFTCLIYLCAHLDILRGFVC